LHKRVRGVTATVVVYSTTHNVVLLVKRETTPFKGSYAFPGGFLEVGEEDLEQTAYREVFEETGLAIDKTDYPLELVDVRSSPNREPRGQIIDVGYLCKIEGMPLISGSFETEPIWVAIENIDKILLAFDHEELWDKVNERIEWILNGC
jgi:8-oxo-dGTP diphosphatase